MSDPESKLVPLTEDEVRCLGIQPEQMVQVDYEVGDSVKVISGVRDNTVGDQSHQHGANPRSQSAWRCLAERLL